MFTFRAMNPQTKDIIIGESVSSLLTKVAQSSGEANELAELVNLRQDEFDRFAKHFSMDEKDDCIVSLNEILNRRATISAPLPVFSERPSYSSVLILDQGFCADQYIPIAPQFRKENLVRSVEENKALLVIGRRGSGKSTVLKLLAAQGQSEVQKEDSAQCEFKYISLANEAVPSYDYFRKKFLPKTFGFIDADEVDENLRSRRFVLLNR